MSNQGYVHRFEIDSEHSLYIYRGSLVEVEADALVSSDDNYLSAGGGVSEPLAWVAGREVRRERLQIVQEDRPRLGDVVRTSPGALPCRHLYHAITIDFDRHLYMDEAALRRLIANLLARATADGVRSLGMPALGTGAAFFDLALASEIIIDELLVRLVQTPVERVVLALIGDEAERLFYERLVRSRADRLAMQALRRREALHTEVERQGSCLPPPSDLNTDEFDLQLEVEVEEGPETSPLCCVSLDVVDFEVSTLAEEDVELPLPVSEAVEEVPALAETVEQFPSLVDEERLASAGPGRPRLVEGLADLILEHAKGEDVEQELLRSPECRNFQGTLKQRLMEFLYLSESHLRKALGPALFRNRDLRAMAQELGEDSDLPRDPDQLVTTILRALCFNTLSPPTGMDAAIDTLERLRNDVRGHESDSGSMTQAVLGAAQVLDQTLKDLLRLYAYHFWGPDGEPELVRRKLLPSYSGASPVTRATLGTAHTALHHLHALLKRDSGLKAKWEKLGRATTDFLPRKLDGHSEAPALDGQTVVQRFIELRNRVAHPDPPPRWEEVPGHLDRLHAFLCACKAGGYYPDVLRYDGTLENRHGERFVHFLDEKGKLRTVRTDAKIDPRRHYYCFATNNPMHLHPILIPKG